MEHILQFGVNIDDDAIVRHVCESVQKEVSKKLREDVMRELVGSATPTRYDYRKQIKTIAEEIVHTVISEYKDEIISRAANDLSARLVRTKAVREAVGDVLASIKFEVHE